MKFTVKILGFALSMICMNTIKGQTTINLIADFDAALGYHDNYNTSGTNYGTEDQNGAYVQPGYNGGLNINRALIHFDLSAIPSGATITSAKLNLYALGPSGHTGQNNNAVLQRVTGSWLENSVTWNSQPATTTQNEVSLAASTSPLQDYLDIEVTQLVHDMHTNNNYGFLLKLFNENPTNVLLFASINSGDSTKFPKLEVTYSDCSTIITSNDAAIGYHDNYNTSSTNYGTEDQNGAYVQPGYNGGLNINRALIHFDLSSIPSGATITSAKLNLYALGPSGHTGQNNNALLQRVTESWLENIVTWDAQPATTAQNEVSLPASTSPMQDYLDIEVTQLVQDMYTNNNYGFLLKLFNENPTNVLLFCSSDYFDITKHPKLEVCYSKVSNTDNESIQTTKALFNVFPNPTSGKVYIESDLMKLEDNFTIEVYSNIGELLKSTLVNKDLEEIDMGNLTSGIYFIKLFSNKQSFTKKIILSNNQ